MSPQETQTAAPKASDVRIDRLVLEMPGISEAAAREVSLGIAEGLAAAGLTGLHAPGPLIIDPIAGETPARLAARIVAALLKRIG